MDVSVVSTAKAVFNRMADSNNQVQQQVAVTEIKDAIDSQAAMQMRLIESGNSYDMKGQTAVPPQQILNTLL